MGLNMISSSLKKCYCTNINGQFNNTKVMGSFSKRLTKTSSDNFSFKGIQLQKLQNIKKLEPADVLVVLAHPDDEVCFFGFIAKLIKQNKKTVQLVYATSGENGRDIRGLLKRYSPEVKEARENELKRALDKLGLKRDPVMLGLYDGKIRNPETQETMLLSLQRIVDETKPKEIYSFTSEGITRHPDHIALAEILPDVVYMHKKISRQKTRLFQVGFSESNKKALIDAVKGTSGIGLFVKVISSRQPIRPKFNIKNNIPTLMAAFKEQTTQFTEDTVKALEIYFKKHPIIYVSEKKIGVPLKKNVYKFTEKHLKRIEELIGATKNKGGIKL